MHVQADCIMRHQTNPQPFLWLAYRATRGKLFVCSVYSAGKLKTVKYTAFIKLPKFVLTFNSGVSNSFQSKDHTQPSLTSRGPNQKKKPQNSLTDCPNFREFEKMSFTTTDALFICIWNNVVCYLYIYFEFLNLILPVFDLFVLFAMK